MVKISSVDIWLATGIYLPLACHRIYGIDWLQRNGNGKITFFYNISVNNFLVVVVVWGEEGATFLTILINHSSDGCGFEIWTQANRVLLETLVFPSRLLYR